MRIETTRRLVRSKVQVNESETVKRILNIKRNLKILTGLCLRNFKCLKIELELSDRKLMIENATNVYHKVFYI